MPLILAADTSTAINSVALCRDHALLGEVVLDGRRRHSERLLPAVDWLLGETSVELADIELLAISIGPGSFTGLRIGAATWKGLAYANELPLVGVPTLDAMARLAPTPPEGYQVILLDARMKEVFAAVYTYSGGQRQKVVSDRVCPLSALFDAAEALPDFHTKPLSLLGDGVVLYQQAITERWPGAVLASPSQGLPRASAVAIEALERYAAGAESDAGRVNPVYLRKSQAEVNRETRLASQPR
jgi:tRNA threonylcarbamoyladenosine biosynthesis protein TsaB